VAILAAACGSDSGGHSHSHGQGLKDLGHSAVGEALEEHGVEVCHAYPDPDPENAFPLSEEADVMLIGGPDCDVAAEREVVVGRFRTSGRRDESLRRLAGRPEFWLVGFSYGTEGAVAVSKRNPPAIASLVEDAVRHLGGAVAFDHRNRS
jgi:hypothetical protein